MFSLRSARFGLCWGGLAVLLLTVSSAPAQELQDLSAEATVSTANERTVLDRQTRQLTSTVDVTVANESDRPLSAPLHLVLDVGGAAVTVPGAAGGPGTEPYNAFYFDLSDSLSQGVLSPGEHVTRTIQFVRAADVALQYRVRLYGRPSAEEEVPEVITAEAGPDRILMLPANQATLRVILDGSGSTAPGTTLTEYRWSGTPDPADVVKPELDLGQGVYDFELVVADDQGRVSTPDFVRITVQLEGNQPPEIVSAPLIRATQYHVYYYEVNAIDPEGGPVSYELVDKPAGMSVDPASGVIVWSPGPNQTGAHTVEVAALDAEQARDAQAFTVEVEPHNLPPQFTSVPGRAARVGEPYVYNATAYDPEGDDLSFGPGAVLPAGMTVAATGRVEWTPAPGDVGIHDVALQVADPEGAFDQQGYLIEVIDPSEPLEVIRPTGEHRIKIGQELRLPLEASHPEAAFTVEPRLENGRIEGEYFYFTPAKGQEGTHPVAFIAHFSDMKASSVVSLIVERDNAAPTIASIAPQTVAEGQQLTLALEVADADDDPLDLSVAGALPENAVLNEITHEFLFAPGFDQAGTYELTFVVSDGMDAASADVEIVVTDTPPTASNLEVNLDPPASPTFLTRQTISGTINGEAGPPQTAPLIFITGLAPDKVRQGRSETVTLTGLNTAFEPGVTTVDFGPGISVESFEVLSPTSARAVIAADEQAPVGLREVSVAQSGLNIYSVVAFRVEPGAATVAGQIVDPLTQQPLSNTRVAIEGTGIVVFTDSEGRFEVDGLDSGAVTLLITRPNYEVRRVPLALGPNQNVQLEEPLPLNALARPPQPAGSLPRAATLASVLDRNVGSVTGGLSVEQAEELILDTLLVVGGTQVGVYDEAGRQLNPKVSGAGLMTLSPEGVRRQAEAMVQGDTYSLDDIVQMIAGAFAWMNDQPPTTPDVVKAFQEAVNDAWANPNDPGSAMAILLFNEGTVLMSQPPMVTGDRLFNRFQTFLLITSFLVHNITILDEAIDNLLIEHGLDPDRIAAGDLSGVEFARRMPRPDEPTSPDFVLRDTLASALEAAFEWVFGGPAYAQEGGVTIPPPNDYFERPYFEGQTYNRVWSYLKGQILSDALQAAMWNTVASLAFRAVAAVAIGSTGGLGGVLVATTIVASAVDGLISAFMGKYVVGAFVAAHLEGLTPPPPLPDSSRIVGDKLILRFDTSTADNDMRSDQSAKQRPFNYTYQVFRFDDPRETDISKGVLLKDAVLEPIPSDEIGAGQNQLQFVIPLHTLKVGANFLRIAAIQYVPSVTQFFDEAGQFNANPPTFTYQDQFGYVGVDTVSSKVDLVSKFQDLLTPDEKTILADLEEQDLKALIDGTTLEEIRSERKRLEIELELFRTGRRARAFEAVSDARWDFREKNLAALTQAARLHDVVEKGASAGDSPDIERETFNKVKEVLGAGPNDGVPPDLHARLTDLHRAAVERNRRSMILEKCKAEKLALEELESFFDRTAARPNVDYREVLAKYLPGGSDHGIIKIEPRGPAGSTEFNVRITLTNAEGLPEVHTQRIDMSVFHFPFFSTMIPDRANAIENASEAVSKAQADVEIRKNSVMEQRVGKKEMGRFQRKISQESARAAAVEQEYNKLQEKLWAVDRKERNVAPGQATARQAKVQPWLNWVDKFGKALETAGYVATVTEPIEQILRGLRVLYSELSPAHMFVLNPREAFPPDIEPHPDINNWGSFIVGTVDETNPKAGWIETVSPGRTGYSDRISAGFPPAYLAVDPDGTIFANNTNSNSRFSGRIFRYDPQEDGGFARTLAGTINYYSTQLQFGRPAAPVAATIAYVQSSDGTPQYELLMADIEYVGNKKRVIRVPVSLAETHPGFANGQARERIVGQDLVVSDLFRFSGPTDLAAAPLDGTPFQIIYMSDEDTIFRIRHNYHSGDTQLETLLRSPGFRWSGLAVDIRGTLYMADYNSGRIYALTRHDLDGGGDLAPRLLSTSRLRGPADIELDPSQNRLGVSTVEGVQVLTVPATLVGDSVQALRVRNFTKVTEVFRVFQDGVVPHFNIPITDFDLERREVRLSMKVYDPELDASYWRDVTVNLTPLGLTTIVADDISNLVGGRD